MTIFSRECSRQNINGAQSPNCALEYNNKFFRANTNGARCFLLVISKVLILADEDFLYRGVILIIKELFYLAIKAYVYKQ